MERCPSCQAEIRPGSRFCTQCGARLPEPPVADPWPGPPGSGLNQGWPLPEAAPAPAESARDLDFAGGQEPAPHAGEPTDGPLWAETPTADAQPPVAAWPTPVAQAEPPMEAGAWVSPEFAEATVEDAVWRPAAAPDSPDAAVPGAAGDEAATAPSEGGNDASPFDEASAAPARIAVLPEIVPVTDSSSEGDDPTARAAVLVDELRALLPRLAATPGDLGVVADRLDAAANDESGRWPDLRAAMEDARASPRDVETVLDLSRRVDEVIALIDANDRLAATAREAAAAIRRGSADRA